MVIYAFIATGAWRARALTSDASGSNLPSDLGPWRQAEHRPVLLFAEATDPVYRAVKRSGFLVLSGSSARLPSLSG
jgi:hypothetical protein